MNKHIENYLKEYIELDKPEFAVLLTGKWGSGKTYFIDTFMTKIENKIEFIKISFFGILNKDDLQHEIIIKLLGINNNSDLVKKGSKVGAKIINSFGKKLGLSIYDIPIGEILNKINKKIVFIFDDLERASISLHEILGHINGYVEILKFNVIILANELEIKDEEYQKFKEKVIGKTFEVQHDFNTILSSFIDENTDKSKKYLNEHKNIIKDIYTKADYHNLRHIKQILLDFEYFAKNIHEKYLDNKEFISILINNFFALSIELKSGSLKEKELYEHDDFNYLLDEDKEKSNVSKIYEKYNIEKNSIFSGQGWAIVLLKSCLSSEEINNIISDLSFFIEEKNTQRASWVKLWHYRELENDDFEIVLKDVLDKFKSCSYERPEYLLHVIDLLIFFNKNELSTFTLEQIENQVTTFIEQYKTTSIWKDELLEDSDWNSTGLGYIDKKDENFSRLCNLIIEENKNAYDENKIDEIKTLIETISDWDENSIKNLLLVEYEIKPIFQYISAKNLTEQINKISNHNIYKLGYILDSRYRNISLSDKIIEELFFWEDMKKEFKISKTAKGLKKLLLKEFENHIIDVVIEKLESHDKSS